MIVLSLEHVRTKPPGRVTLGDRNPERGRPLCRLSPSNPDAPQDPHSRLLWVAGLREVGLPEAGSHVSGGEWGEAVCVDHHFQRL